MDGAWGVWNHVRSSDDAALTVKSGRCGNTRACMRALSPCLACDACLPLQPASRVACAQVVKAGGLDALIARPASAAAAAGASVDGGAAAPPTSLSVVTDALECLVGIAGCGHAASCSVVLSQGGLEVRVPGCGLC